MRFLAVFFTFILLLLSGCAQVRTDSSMSTILANYPTLEFWLGDVHYHGSAVINIEKGSRLSSIDLKIQTYYRGTLRISSVASGSNGLDCDYDNELGYEGSQVVSIPVPGSVGSYCTYAITLSPEYPHQKTQSHVISSFRGYIRFRGIPPDTHWIGKTTRTSDGSGSSALFLPASSARDVVVKGCGVNFKQNLEPSNGLIRLNIQQLGLNTHLRNCALEGILLGDLPADDLLFTWLVMIYDHNFTPLAKPVVEVSGNKIKISGDDNVSVVALDHDYTLNRQGKFKFDPLLPHTIRLLTIAGRSVVGDWDPDKKTWKWVSDESS